MSNKLYKAYYIFLTLIIVVFISKLGWNMYFNKVCGVENFQMYTQKPFNYKLTGHDPLHFYRRDRYKKPFRHPYKFASSYPINHMRFLD